jgi:hypothetical protein
VTVDHATANSQAVAELQGNTMSNKDLADFFAKYFKTYKRGQDDVVFKYVGDKDVPSSQTEASLDIQYIMGTTQGVKIEFGLNNNQGFCASLAEWSSLVLSTADAPMVHSMSYGLSASWYSSQHQLWTRLVLMRDFSNKRF